MSAAATPFIAADVGGTHARVGLVEGARRGGRVKVLAYRKYVCADYPDLDTILRDFIAANAPVRADRCALACAGYPLDGMVINDNLPWTVSIPRLRESLAMTDLSLINDFEAVAHAVRFIDPAETLLLTGPDSGQGPVLVVGPGTGLGSAVWIPGKAGGMALATEAGQISLAPGTAREREVLAQLAKRRSHVSYEHVLSGPGLLTLYNVFNELHDKAALPTTPEAITGAALAGADPVAREAMDTFCALLGSFVGNLTMLYGARGGVCLTGGVLPGIRDYLKRSRFTERFLDKGTMRAFLERVPVRLVEHGQLGVIGAAGWYLDDRDQ